MEIRDLNPERNVYVTPNGRAAHLHSDCKSMGAKKKRKRAAQLWDDTPVCGNCLQREARWGGGGDKTDATRLLEDLTPEDWP